MRSQVPAGIPVKGTSLANCRNRLQNRIDDFQSEAVQFLAEDLEGTVHTIGLDNGEWDEVDNATADGDTDTITMTDEDTIPPERQSLNMPSAVATDSPSATFQKLQDKEFELRVAEANDALSKLRLAVAQRSMVYRTTVRLAKTYKTLTRARKQTESASAVVAAAARLYSHCRRTLVALRPQSPLLKRYQKLEMSDLKADTTTLDFNARGTKNARLSWIWGMDTAENDENELMDGESADHI